MNDISAAQVKALRERTGVGLMECKKALTDAKGAFTLPNLTKTKHILTPTKDGFQFYPPSITVDLSKGDVSNVAFVGSASINERMYIPIFRSPHSASSAGAAYAVTDASFELACDDGGCTLVGPLE